MPVIKQESSRGGGKRKAKTEDLVFIGTKRRKTEQEHFNDQVEKKLKEARDMALEGNKSMMDFFLSQAAEKAIKINMTISAKASKIRSLLTRKAQDEFTQRKFKKLIDYAQEYAIQGNATMMQFYLRQARDLATQRSTLLEEYQSQADAISQSLSIDNANSFLRKTVAKKFEDAESFAMEGNRSMMMFYLKEAKTNAEKLTALDAAFWKRYKTIESSIKGRQELKFYRKKHAYCLKEAEDYAASGNRAMVDYYLSEARSYGTKAGIPMNEMEKAIHRIRKSIAVATPVLIIIKDEPETTTQPNVSTATMSRAPRASAVVASISNAANKNDDEVVLEKEVSLEERLALQLQGETRAGRIIQVD